MITEIFSSAGSWSVARRARIQAFVCVRCGVCAESVCGMCVFCFGVVVCCVVMCGAVAGVGVQCVVCGVWCLWCVWCVRGVCCVCGAAWHADNPLCVGSKRPRVYRQNERSGFNIGVVIFVVSSSVQVFEPTASRVIPTLGSANGTSCKCTATAKLMTMLLLRWFGLQWPVPLSVATAGLCEGGVADQRVRLLIRGSAQGNSLRTDAH